LLVRSNSAIRKPVWPSTALITILRVIISRFVKGRVCDASLEENDQQGERKQLGYYRNVSLSKIPAVFQFW
jgi:hypothetical protein